MEHRALCIPVVSCTTHSASRIDMGNRFIMLEILNKLWLGGILLLALDEVSDHTITVREDKPKLSSHLSQCLTI